MSDGVGPSRRRERADAHLPRDRRRSIADGRDLPEHVQGAALFADVSGFTPLTEAMARVLGPQRGAEELAVHLDRVFSAIIDEIHGHGGEVIYFSGDGLTCWFDDDDASCAVACGLAIQRVVAAAGDVEIGPNSRAHIAMKVVVSAGQAHRFVVGDPSVQLFDVLAGRPVDELAEAEHLAGRGEVVVTTSVARHLADRLHVTASRQDGDVTVAVVAAVRSATSRSPPRRDAVLDDELVRPWVAPALFARLQGDRRDGLLAELRPACPLFVRFAGIDTRRDDASARLDAFVRHCQTVVSRFGGSVVQLTLGDKGAYLYAVFGAPLAHEDDASRAAAAAMALLASDDSSEGAELQIGLGYGRLWSGTYGHAERRAFSCMGDAVNLTARLMMRAPTGHVYAMAAASEATGSEYRWAPVGALAMKGRAESVPVVTLIGRDRTGVRSPRLGHLPYVDRVDAALQMARWRDEARIVGRVVTVVGETGIGKSRLVAEVLRDQLPGTTVLEGAADAFERSTSYLTWRPIWRALLQADGRVDVEPAAAVIGALRPLGPTHVARAPLVGAVLGHELPDNALTASFDAKLRKASLEALLADVLRARASTGPIVVVLEDAQWADELSINLLEALAWASVGLPVLFVLALRPADAPKELWAMRRLPGFRQLDVGELARPSAEQLLRAKVTELWGAGTAVVPELVAFVVERAHGNPLYLEQLVDWIYTRGVDPGDASAMRELDLPDSLHSLILSRTDRLAESPRRTVKVASVVGRSFASPVLGDIYPELGDADDIDADLRVLEEAAMVVPERRDPLQWWFRSLVTREVAYESLPFGVRRHIHGRIGIHLERQSGEGADLDALAHHYGLSDDRAKQIEYLDRAGDAAQRRYANDAAIGYFRRLAELVADDARAGVLLRLGGVLELTGDWAGARDVLEDALAASVVQADGERAAWCEVALAEVERKQGRYAEAQARLDRAAEAFGRAGVDAGTARTRHLAGTLAAQQGDYLRARHHYDESMEMAERLDDRAGMAAALSNLGIVAEYAGDYAGSLVHHRRALALREEIGDRWALAVSHTNLGMIAVHEARYDDARQSFEESMRLSLEVGDGWMVAITNNNLGNAQRGVGDHEAAQTSYGAAAEAFIAYDDHWALAFLLEDVARLAVAAGDAMAAHELVGAADAQRNIVGSPRSPALDEALRSELDRATPADKHEACLVARQRGADLDTGAAVETLRRVCRSARR